MLFDIFRHRRHHATELPAAQAHRGRDPRRPGQPDLPTARIRPRLPAYGSTRSSTARRTVPELEALHRWAMVLHNQYPWDRSQVRLTEVGKLHDDDFVVLFRPRNDEVRAFIRAAKGSRRPRPPTAARPPRPASRSARTPPSTSPSSSGVHAAARGAGRRQGRAPLHERRPDPQRRLQLVADDCGTRSSEKTGIQQRLYTERDLDDIALEAARAALAHAGRRPEEIGAVLFCSCTSTRLMPSVATLAVRPAGDATRRTARPTSSPRAPDCPTAWLRRSGSSRRSSGPSCVVCGEKFSDKIGNVRPSRMIFGDGAAAIVVGPAPEDQPSDIEWLPDLRRAAP